jgi:TRAP-type C4-dicarboxylate transport system permease small subunit
MMATLGRWLSRLDTVLLYLGVLATFAMMCLTSADAFSRYLFNRPILGALELTEKYFMVAAIFLGLSYAYRGGLLIRVTFLVDRLPRGARIAAEAFAHVITLGFCALMVYATGQQALRGLSDDTELSTLPLRVGPAYSLVLVGFLALTVVLLVDLARMSQGRSLLASSETSAAS